MARKPRREVIDETKTGAYHVWSRTVRQAYLLGYDGYRKRNCDHRKTWLLVRLAALAGSFAVECLDEAVLDNHFHLILRNRPDLAAGWSDVEVARRWLRLKQSALELNPEPSAQAVAEFVQDAKAVKKARKKLSSISAFMAHLKEPVARLANEEDETAGNFWASRFGCRRLRDDASLLVCSLYVSMNTFRAGKVRRLEDDRFSATGLRVADLRRGDASRTCSGWLQPVHVDGDGYDGAGARRRPSNLGYLGLSLGEYLELLDGLMRREQAGRLSGTAGAEPSLAERLGIDPAEWETAVRLTSRRFARELETSAKMLAEGRQ